MQAMLSDDPTFDPNDPLASRHSHETAERLKAHLAQCIEVKHRIPEMRVRATCAASMCWRQGCAEPGHSLDCCVELS
jgi:hypothetical protein